MQEDMYVELFATKGVEYLLVIGFLAALIAFWRLLNRPMARSVSTTTLQQPAGTVQRWFSVARDRFYHPGHSWAQVADEGLVTIGIDDFAQKLIGKPEAIALPAVGACIAQGECGSWMEIDGSSLALLSPVDGEVVDHNAAVLDDPELINRDPYGAGWLMKVKPSRMVANLKSLMPVHIAVPWMETTERALGRMMSRDLGIVLQDGGVPVSGIARALSSDRWEEIAKAFLLTDDGPPRADHGGQDDTGAGGPP